MDAEGCTPVDGSAPSPLEVEVAELAPTDPAPAAPPAAAATSPPSPQQQQQAAPAAAAPAGLQPGDKYHPGKYIKGAPPLKFDRCLIARIFPRGAQEMALLRREVDGCRGVHSFWGRGSGLSTCSTATAIATGTNAAAAVAAATGGPCDAGPTADGRCFAADASGAEL